MTRLTLATPLEAAADWIDEDRMLLERRLDRLDDYLRELQAQPAPEKKPHGRKGM